MSVIIEKIAEDYKLARKIMGFKKVIRDFKEGKETSPLSLQVQTISYCNASCVFCPYPHTSKITSQGKMEWCTYKKIVDESADFPDLRAFQPILQNEPLLDKNICKAIRYFKERNGDGIPVNISTNGYLLNNGLIKELIDSGLNYLCVSLNAINKETYEKLLPGMKFERVIENIEKLLSHDLKQMKVSVRFLKTNKNEDEIPEAVRYWHSKGIRTEVVSLLNNRGGSVDIGSIKPVKKQKTFRDSLRQHFVSFFAECCVFPFRQMYILYNGDVIICGNDWKRDPILGNVNNQSLRDIWNGPKALQFRRMILEKKYESVPPCKNCTMVESFSSWL